MEMMAKELRIDSAEIRLRNFVRRPQFPYTTAIGAVYDSGDYERTFRRMLITPATSSQIMIL